MAETKSIRVNNVRAADPTLSFAIQIADGGTFPAYIYAHAGMTGNPDGGSYSGDSPAYQPGTATSQNVTITFADDQYGTETDLDYTITVYFSSDGRNWSAFSGNYNNTQSGDVTASHSVVAAEAETAEAPNEERGGDLSKRKGCLGFLF